MATIPTCERIVTALTDETAYGTAIADGALDTMFSIINPDLPEITLDTIDDRELIKGHEFLEDANAFKILFQNVNFTMTGIPLSAEFLGWLIAAAMGNITSAEIAMTSDFTHIAKIADKCTNDQLPSRTLGVLWAGSSAVNRKYKGCVVNSFTIRITEKGYVTCDVSWITDGDEASGSAISVPTTFHSTSFLYGLDVALEYEDFETSLVTETTKFAGFEVTYNNNLDIEVAKKQTFATQTTLPELRIGDRTIEASLTLYLDESSDEWADAIAGTRKVIRITVTGPTLAGGNTADMVIDIPQARWMPAGKGFDGTKRTITLDHLFYNDATEGTPLKITATTRDTVYL